VFDSPTPAETDEVDCMHPVFPAVRPAGPSWTGVLGDELLEIAREGAVALCEVGGGEIVDPGWLDRQGQLVEGSQDS